MRDGMRLAGIRDHADEDADSGLPSDDVLHTNYEAPTPTTVPGAQTIRTPDLVDTDGTAQAVGAGHDTHWGQSIPGAVGLWGAGVGGSVSDEFQDRLGRKMQQLTGGDRNMPIVAMGWNSERYQGRNLALRLVALGYTESTGIAAAARRGRWRACRRPKSHCRTGSSTPRHAWSPASETGNGLYLAGKAAGNRGLIAICVCRLVTRPHLAIPMCIDTKAGARRGRYPGPVVFDPGAVLSAVVSEIGSGLDLAGKAAGGRRLIAIVYADMVGYSR